MENKSVTPEELEMLLSFRRKYEELSFRYGQLEFGILTMAKEQDAVKEEFGKLAEEEQNYLDQLMQTYGEGQINLETGEIIQSD